MHTLNGSTQIPKPWEAVKQVYQLLPITYEEGMKILGGMSKTI